MGGLSGSSAAPPTESALLLSQSRCVLELASRLLKLLSPRHTPTFFHSLISSVFMADPDSRADTEESSVLDANDPDDAASADPDDAPDSTDASDDASEVDDLHFDDDDLGEKLRHASDEQLDNAPFGIIQVDDDGIVKFFNQYESDLSGMDPDEVLGRNFFTQVAPCTNNRLFRGRFKKGMRRGELEETFTYTYTYEMRPTLVDIFMYRDEAGNNWITVQKY